MSTEDERLSNDENGTSEGREDALPPVDGSAGESDKAPKVDEAEPVSGELPVPEPSGEKSIVEPFHEFDPARIEILSDEEAKARMRQMSRRGFLVAGIAATAGYAGWRWLVSQPREASLARPFRRVLRGNESIAQAYYDRSRLSRTFPRERAALVPRVNGHIGLDPRADHADWRLRLEGVAGTTQPILVGLDEIKALPRREMVTELRCIEGWTIIVHWTGARLSDLMDRYPPTGRGGERGDLATPEQLVRYVALETPGRQYYVGLDMASALHPQTLLAYAINDQPLSWDHGAPLRLAIPVKYGIKSIKRISTIRYTDIRPADFWADRGYDWYAGH